MKKLSHAYIVSSPSESAGEAAAEELAQKMLCAAGGDSPCGKCRDCRKVKAHIHPDVCFVERESDDKGKLRGEITVGQIREMGASASVLPNEASGKVYIIKQADKMNVQAQNAALKLFEEPPAGVHFILCVQNGDKLLETVRSRCAELRVAAEEDAEDEAAAQLAGEFSAFIEKGDTAGLTAWCFAHEKLDGAQLDAFLAALRRSFVQMLISGENKNRIMDNIRLVDRCIEYRTVNTGVKHILGLLAVASAVESRK